MKIRELEVDLYNALEIHGKETRDLSSSIMEFLSIIMVSEDEKDDDNEKWTENEEEEENEFAFKTNNNNSNIDDPIPLSSSLDCTLPTYHERRKEWLNGIKFNESLNIFVITPSFPTTGSPAVTEFYRREFIKHRERELQARYPGLYFPLYCEEKIEGEPFVVVTTPSLRKLLIWGFRKYHDTPTFNYEYFIRKGLEKHNPFFAIKRGTTGELIELLNELLQTKRFLERPKIKRATLYMKVKIDIPEQGDEECFICSDKGPFFFGRYGGFTDDADTRSYFYRIKGGSQLPLVNRMVFSILVIDDIFFVFNTTDSEIYITSQDKQAALFRGNVFRVPDHDRIQVAKIIDYGNKRVVVWSVTLDSDIKHVPKKIKISLE